MVFTYYYNEGIYLNITNRCTNDCIFCLRNFGKPIGGYDLNLSHEPSEKEILEDVEKKSHDKKFSSVKEIVFCGLGEPLIRLDEIVLPVSKKLRQYGKDIRLNTNGHALFLYPGRNVAKELYSSGLRRISISLNAENSWKYSHLCYPNFNSQLTNKEIYEGVLNFVKQCKSERLETQVSFIDLTDSHFRKEIVPDINSCKNLSSLLEVEYKIRKYICPEK